VSWSRNDSRTSPEFRDEPKKKGGPSQESPPLVIMLIGATTGYGKRGAVVPVQIAALSGFASCDCPSNVSVPPSGSRVTIVESLP